VVPGMVRVVLDGRGRLIRFDGVPREPRQDIPASARADWQALFTDAGLSLAAFAPAEPDRIPPVYADGRQAWTGTYPGRSDIAIRVEGATLGAVPVYFHVTGAWTTSALPERSGAPEVITAFTAGLLILMIVVGGLLAHRNLRFGRSDVTGARRLAIVVFLMGWGAWLLAADHVASFDEVELLFADLSADLFNAALLWLAYVALEPLVRRRWPHLMTSWTRLLAGRWRDPLVGRDVLIGTVAVTTGVASVHAINRLALLAGWMPAQPMDAIPVLLEDGLLDYAGWVLAFFGAQASTALALVLLLLLLSLALRRWTLSAAALVAIVSSVYAIGAAGSMNPIAGAVFGAIGPVVLVRYGVLATVAATGFSLLALMTPITFDPSAWYMANGLFLIALTLAAATYGFSVALAGQPLFGRALLDDQ
jgi:serine/threonine-protein kinase